jgi:membrane protease YdiL (CAAX protease family)
MTDASSTDAIDQWISSWSAASRCGLGAGAIAIGLLAALGVTRRLLPAPAPDPAPKPRPPEPPEATGASLRARLIRFRMRIARELPGSFRFELLPLLALVYVGAAWAALRLLAPPAAAGTELPLRVKLLALDAVAAAVFLFLALWTRVLGGGLADLGFTARRLGPILLGTVAFYAAWFPVWFGATALESGVGELLHRTPAVQSTVLALAKDGALLRDPLVVAALLVAAPLYEEMIFRGVLLRALLAVAPAGVAVVLDAALFCAFHDGGFSTVFVLGVALAWLMARTRSIAAPICFHVVHNGLTVLLIALCPG